MFGRVIGVSLLKKNKNEFDDPTYIDSQAINDIGYTVVETVKGVGGVVIAVAITFTFLRIMDAAAKRILR